MTHGMRLWTGFHWCSPTNPGTYADVNPVDDLFRDSGRWGAVIVLTNENRQAYLDTINHLYNDILRPKGVDLFQVITRIWVDYPDTPAITDFNSADQWWQTKYRTALDRFAALGGRMVIVGNEPNVENYAGPDLGGPSKGITRRTLALISQGIRNAYWNGGNRLMYTLFPGPGGGALSDLNQWSRFWGYWDLRLLSNDLWTGPLTFDQTELYTGTNESDPMLDGRTMLWHGGNGGRNGACFDRVALHGYADSPTAYSDADPYTNTAMIPIRWYSAGADSVQDPGGPMPAVDNTGWCYLTETTGAQCDDQGDAGFALAAFEHNADVAFGPGNANSFPPLLQAIYGYILEASDPEAKDGPCVLVPNPPPTLRRHGIGVNAMGAYNTGRTQFGIG